MLVRDLTIGRKIVIWYHVRTSIAAEALLLDFPRYTLYYSPLALRMCNTTTILKVTHSRDTRKWQCRRQAFWSS